MKDLYNLVQISKQAHYKNKNRQKEQQQIEALCLLSIFNLRELHPKMGSEKMYHILKPDGIGRDKFSALYIENGYSVRPIKNYSRTTYSTRSHRYSNLCEDIRLTDVNQLWSSDITYFDVKGVFYYITFIIDVYSRRIIGYWLSSNLQATANVNCLKMALNTRNLKSYKGLIHHSDRGVQYASHAYTNILDGLEIGISMCTSPYENAHIERVNGVIKNEYLLNWSIQTQKQLKKMLDIAVYRYNNLRPIAILGMKTPVEYEEYLKSAPKEKRTNMKIYVEKKAEKTEKIIQLKLAFSE